MHSLLAELGHRFAAHGVEARVYRGFTAEDPMPSTHDRLLAAVRAIEARAVRYSSEMTAGGSQTLAIAAVLASPAKAAEALNVISGPSLAQLEEPRP